MPNGPFETLSLDPPTILVFGVVSVRLPQVGGPQMVVAAVTRGVPRGEGRVRDIVDVSKVPFGTFNAPEGHLQDTATVAGGPSVL